MPPKVIKVIPHGPEADSHEAQEDSKTRDARIDSQYPEDPLSVSPDTASPATEGQEENVQPQPPAPSDIARPIPPPATHQQDETPQRRRSSTPPSPANQQDPAPTLPATTYPSRPSLLPSEGVIFRDMTNRPSRPVLNTRVDRLSRQESESFSPTNPGGRDPSGMTERQRQKSAVSVSTPEDRQNVVPSASAQYPSGREGSSTSLERVYTRDFAESPTGVTRGAGGQRKIQFSVPTHPARERQGIPQTAERSPPRESPLYSPESGDDEEQASKLEVDSEEDEVYDEDEDEGFQSDPES